MTEYASINFKTKKALKEAVASGQKIRVRHVSVMGDTYVTNGTAYLSGPWYPEPHKWYAEVSVKDGFITTVK